MIFDDGKKTRIPENGKEIPVGKLFVKKYGHRFTKMLNTSLIEGTCCFGKCNNPHTGIYMGFPFCERHWQWVYKKVEEIYREEKRRR